MTSLGQELGGNFNHIIARNFFGLLIPRLLLVRLTYMVPRQEHVTSVAEDHDPMSAPDQGVQKMFSAFQLCYQNKSCSECEQDVRKTDTLTDKKTDKKTERLFSLVIKI